jgi:hypothetical protein
MPVKDVLIGSGEGRDVGSGEEGADGLGDVGALEGGGLEDGDVWDRRPTSPPDVTASATATPAPVSSATATAITQGRRERAA